MLVKPSQYLNSQIMDAQQDEEQNQESTSEKTCGWDYGITEQSELEGILKII